MQIDLTQQRIAKVTCNTSIRGNAENAFGMPLLLEGKMQSKLTTSEALNVEKLIAKAPKFRRAFNRDGNTQLAIALPSYWGTLQQAQDVEDQAQWVDTRDGSSLIELRVISADNGDPKAFKESALDALEEEFGKLDSMRVSSSLGAGWYTEIDIEDEAGQAFRARLEFYKHRLGWLRVRLFAPAANFKRGLEELKRARKTLQDLGR